MPVQTEHRFPLDLSVLDAAGSRVTPADLRGCNAPTILPQRATKG
jgi:hypothetical protein